MFSFACVRIFVCMCVCMCVSAFVYILYSSMRQLSAVAGCFPLPNERLWIVVTIIVYNVWVCVRIFSMPYLNTIGIVKWFRGRRIYTTTDYCCCVKNNQCENKHLEKQRIWCIVQSVCVFRWSNRLHSFILYMYAHTYTYCARVSVALVSYLWCKAFSMKCVYNVFFPQHYIRSTSALMEESFVSDFLVANFCLDPNRTKWSLKITIKMKQSRKIKIWMRNGMQ